MLIITLHVLYVSPLKRLGFDLQIILDAERNLHTLLHLKVPAAIVSSSAPTVAMDLDVSTQTERQLLDVPDIQEHCTCPGGKHSSLHWPKPRGPSKEKFYVVTSTCHS